MDIRQGLRSQRRFSRYVKGSASRIKKRNHLDKQHFRIQEQAIQSDFLWSPSLRTGVDISLYAE